METSSKALRIVIPGGTGQLSQILGRHLSGRGHYVAVARNPSGPKKDRVPWRTMAWDAENLGEWVSSLEGADALINLAGRSVNCRKRRGTLSEECAKNQWKQNRKR
jgi:NAD dependent epimerase/dehydratase family enzyme